MLTNILPFILTEYIFIYNLLLLTGRYVVSECVVLAFVKPQNM